jgi:DNA replication protein DnaC
MLRLPTIRAQFEDMAEVAEREQMSYRGFLAELLMAECDDRARRRSERRIKAAGFPRDKSLRAFDFDANPHIDAATIHTLVKCKWIRKGLPLCLIAFTPGTGKSHLLIALGTEAAMAGFRVKYTLAAKLVNELVGAADEKQLTKTIARYGRVDLLRIDLLCIDELGYMELDKRGAELLFQVLTEREEKNFRGDRLQRQLRLLDKDLHRPAALRRDRRPAHLRRQHHRNRHRLLSTCPHQSRPRRDDDQPGRPSGNTHPPRQAVISCLSLAYRWSLISEWQTESGFLPMQLAQT